MADYISKQRAKDLMGCCLASAKAEYKSAKDEFTKARFEDYISTIQAMIDVVGSVEAADVQPVKHGKWESSQRTIETGTVYCSNCAIEYYISDLQTVGDCNGIVHYCPNCGARMDLGDEKT